MCNLKTRYRKQKQFVGYKVAVHVDGKFYSPATGIEYKIGKVEIPNEINMKYATGAFEDNLLCPRRPYFNTNMIGRTAAFEYIGDARGLFNDILPMDMTDDLKIIQITLSRSLMKGNYDGENVVAGKYIESIKIVQ